MWIIPPPSPLLTRLYLSFFDMKLHAFGHSCFLIESGRVSVLIDPFIRPNEQAAHVDVEALLPTHILLTHGHEDHVADAEDIARRSGAELIAPYEVATWFGLKGVERIRPINPGATFTLSVDGDDIAVRCVSAAHSSTLPDGSPGGVAAGYLLEAEGTTVYHAGDTALSPELGLIGQLWTPDVAILPIGGTFTMGVGDVPAAMDMLNCKHVVGMHYDTFPPIAIDKAEALRTVEHAGGQLHLPGIGTVLDIPSEHG